MILVKKPAGSLPVQSASNPARSGRPFDRSSDAVILESTLDLLAERDYERVTLDEVAARTGKAKTTLYRRWATKEDLVLAAIRAAGRPPEYTLLPDLGTLRSDLLSVIDSPWLGGPIRRLSIFAGLDSATRSSARLASAIRSEVTEPYGDLYLRLLHRALDRGEISGGRASSISVLAQVIPAMSSHRLALGPDAVDREFFVSVVDDIVLAALGIGGEGA